MAIVALATSPQDLEERLARIIVGYWLVPAYYQREIYSPFDYMHNQLGGNIRGQTRTLTTAMVLETGKGNFEIAIALSILLLVLVFVVNWVLTSIQQRRVW